MDLVRLFESVVADVVDGLLGGAPTRALMHQIREETRLEINEIEAIMDAVQKRMNEIDAETLSRNQILDELYSNIDGLHPLGAAFQLVMNRLYSEEESVKKAEEERQKLYDQYNQSQQELSKKYDKLYMNVGDWIEKYGTMPGMEQFDKMGPHEEN